MSAGIAMTASQHFTASFGNFLAILLYLFTPWTAINLVDFYLVRRAHYSIREIFNADGMYGRWNWRGLLAYGVGFAVMIPFFSTGLYTGPVAHSLKGADLAMLVGLPVSALVYIVACRSMDVRSDRRRAAAAPVIAVEVLIEENLVLKIGPAGRGSATRPFGSSHSSCLPSAVRCWRYAFASARLPGR